MPFQKQSVFDYITAIFVLPSPPKRELHIWEDKCGLKLSKLAERINYHLYIHSLNIETGDMDLSRFILTFCSVRIFQVFQLFFFFQTFCQVREMLAPSATIPTKVGPRYLELCARKFASSMKWLNSSAASTPNRPEIQNDAIASLVSHPFDVSCRIAVRC